jgi:hypothetical protein
LLVRDDRSHKCLTLALPGTQQAPRSGILRLRVRAEQPVNRIDFGH